MKWFTRLKERRQRYREVFESEDGQWVLADLLQECGYGHDSAIPGDPYMTHYHVGKEWVAKHIRKILGMSDAELAALVHQYEEMERRKDEGIFEHE